jgi:WD40 repeat protein
MFRVAFSPDGRRVAGGSLRGWVRLWDPAGGRLVRSLRHYDDSRAPAFRTEQGRSSSRTGVMVLTFSPDGRSLLSAGREGLLRVWNLDTGRPRAALRFPGEVYAAAFSPDGRAILAAFSEGRDRSGVVVWDVARWAARFKARAHAGTLRAVAFSPDGRLFLTGGGSSESGRWGEARLRDSRTGAEIGPPLRFPEPVRAVAFNPDGQHWLAASAGGDVRVGNLRTARSFATRHVGARARHGLEPSGSVIVTAAFSPDGRTFVTAGDGVQVRETATGVQVGQVPALHGAAVHTAVFSRDGRTLATASRDGTARLW